jgi:DNA-binding transcriptional MerR regulator
MAEPHLTSTELAKRWNVTHFTIRYWRITGKGPAYMKTNGRVNYRVKEIERFEQEKFRAHTSDLGLQH